MSHTRRLPWTAAICPIVMVMGLICPIGSRAAAAGIAPEAAAAGRAGGPRGHPHEGPLADHPRRRAVDDPDRRLLVPPGHLRPGAIDQPASLAGDSEAVRHPVHGAVGRRPDRPRQALALCEENGSPVAQVFAAAVRKWGRPAVEVEQAVIDQGERATNSLRRYIRVFYAITTVGPLLGLMGTVLGMIQTFNVIAAGDALGRAELLAGGIAKALLNTAGGLAVAIPASILYVFFISRVDRLIIRIDALAQEVVNTISAEELQERSGRGAKPRRAPREIHHAPEDPR